MSIVTILIFLAVLSLLVFVHEFGHFITAKRAGVKVEEFGFGFPPCAFGIKKGGTVYSINWLPLGGFVKIKGESGQDWEDKDSFSNKKIWKRMLIVGAGVLMNVFLTAVLLAIGAGAGMPRVVPEEDRFARVKDDSIEVVSVLSNSPAEKAGIMEGDAVAAIDGVSFGKIEEARAYIASKEEVQIKIKREELELVKSIKTEELKEAGRRGIGVALLHTGIVSYPWYIAPLKGIEETGIYIREISFAFGRIIGDMFVGRPVSVDLQGPVGIAVLTGRVARLGFVYLLQFTALLSINLAFINIFPFPALDGGRILFLAIEGIRKKPVPKKVEAMIHNIGFILLITLVIIVTFRDILRYGGGFLDRFN
ncbi:RIP metalloprotease RseP [Candidatus Uhrbacteria bacterium]|nr:RIP metalloprotease RseP [Candidatus Uhrbacteria bacterium]